MSSPVPPPLQPTLWRTCRVLAGRPRLRMLAAIHRHPGLSVTEIARKLSLRLPQASLGLRALESRGLLIVKRAKARVRYHPRIAPAGDPLRELTVALDAEFQRDDAVAVERVYRLATGFTHPRRIELLRCLAGSPSEPGQLSRACKLSMPALGRHLHKLRMRGIVTGDRTRVALAPATDDLTKALLRVAGV